MPNAIEVDNVTKIFRLYQEKYSSLKERVIHAGKIPYQEFIALNAVTFDIPQGTTVGLLGHNGSGKSTLLKTIAGIIQPTSGEIRVKGRISAMLELGAGFHPELSGRDNIFLSATLLGVPVKEVQARFDDIVEFSELGRFIDNQVKHYSSGMYARLGFAVAVNVDPDVLLVDEVLAVGDENFQRKCIDRIKFFQREGRTIVFVSHSPDVVRQVCESAYVLDHGSLIGEGEPAQAIAALRESLQRGGAVGGLIIGDAQDDQVQPPAVIKKERSIELTSIKAYPGIGGSEREQIFPNEPIRVEVAFEVSVSVFDVSLTFQMISPANETIYSANTKDLGIEGFNLDASGVFELNFEDLPLLDGIYGIGVALVDSKNQILHWLDEKAAFQIVNQSRVSGLVSLHFTINSYSIPRTALELP